MPAPDRELDPVLPGSAPWRVAISGSTGLIGTALVESLRRDGHEMRRLVRSRSRAASRDIYWDPAKGELDSSGLEGVDAVVHLAGENLFALWTAARKKRIRDSRVRGTRLLAETLAQLQRPPRVLVSASAVGYYGDSRGDEILDETSSPGTDFLARVTREWEEASEPAADAGIRVVNIRSAPVMSRRGGMLPLLLLPFRMGLGAKLGSGRQWLSWIALQDIVGAIRFILAAETLRGQVNTTSPNPVTNAEFTRALGRVLRRPALLTVPAFAMRLTMGEMAESTALASQRVLPRKLLEAGYRFRYPELEDALRAAIEER